MKSKQTQFLQQLGYTIEDITYKFCDISNNDFNTVKINREVSLAYKTETAEIEEFKEVKTHYREAKDNPLISHYILEDVYKRELEDTLYEMALEHVKRKNLIKNFG